MEQIFLPTIQFFKSHLNTFISVISISIAVFSFLISCYSLNKNRKVLTVEFQGDITIHTLNDILFMYDSSAENISIASLDYIMEKSAKPCFAEIALQQHIKIINPSQNDIAFFSLEACNPETGIYHTIITRESLAPHLKNSKIFLQEDVSQLNIPNKTHGVFKANSFTSLNLIIVPDEDCLDMTKLEIYFYVAIEKQNRFKALFNFFKSDDEDVEMNKYKIYSTTIDLSKWQGIIAAESSLISLAQLIDETPTTLH